MILTLALHKKDQEDINIQYNPNHNYFLKQHNLYQTQLQHYHNIQNHMQKNQTHNLNIPIHKLWCQNLIIIVFHLISIPSAFQLIYQYLNILLVFIAILTALQKLW